ncbi:MAG TPA: proton-conducting transporter membrane subunit, partial [Candidatus Methylomirabilis sp.]|nr:proton-conducting transporter membrane subunit [Candidatus Methylomirabilis sp.]
GRISMVLREGAAFVGLLFTFLTSILIAHRILQGEVLTFWGMYLYVDGLSSLMELLGSSMGFIVILYSLSYVARHPHRGDIGERRLSVYYGLILLFLSMMNLTCATNSIIMLFVSLEATTLATAFLVTFYWSRESLEAGYKYLLLVTVGVTFALLGLVLLYSASIPYLPRSRILLLTELGRIGTKMPGNIVLLASALIIAGFGTKAGLVPFHAWLPDAHAEAPIPVSALLSGIVIKVGAYALARTITIFSPNFPALVLFIAVICSVSMLVGMMMALVQDDIKRMLAYSSISQIAYVVEGLGLGTYLGVYGGLFHLMNHTIVKALLFLAAGSLMFATGSRKISELAAQQRRMPITAFCFFVGSLAISGVPPFNAFLSKFTIFLALAEQGLLWAAVIAVITGFLSIACFGRAAYQLFWTTSSEAKKATPGEIIREVPPTMWTAMIILAGLSILLGFYPQLVHPILNRATNIILSLLAGS